MEAIFLGAASTIHLIAAVAAVMVLFALYTFIFLAFVNTNQPEDSYDAFCRD